MYSFLDNDFFGVYQNTETPKVELKLPLNDNPIELDWADRVTETGIPIVKSSSNDESKSESKLIVNNSPEAEIATQSTPSKQQTTNTAVNTNITGQQKQAMKFFTSKGLSYHQAAGIVGNLMQESNLNTSIKGDGGKSFGIAQWNGDRRKGLQNFAKERGTDISDLNTQLEYVWKELNSTHKSALDGILQSKNSDEATIAFMRKFEKPNEKYANLTARLRYAKSCLS